MQRSFDRITSLWISNRYVFIKRIFLIFFLHCFWTLLIKIVSTIFFDCFLAFSLLLYCFFIIHHVAIRDSTVSSLPEEYERFEIDLLVVVRIILRRKLSFKTKILIYTKKHQTNHYLFLHPVGTTHTWIRTLTPPYESSRESAIRVHTRCLITPTERMKQHCPI